MDATKYYVRVLDSVATTNNETRGTVGVSAPTLHAGVQGSKSGSGTVLLLKNLALKIVCVSHVAPMTRLTYVPSL